MVFLVSVFHNVLVGMLRLFGVVDTSVVLWVLKDRVIVSEHSKRKKEVKQLKEVSHEELSKIIPTMSKKSLFHIIDCASFPFEVDPTYVTSSTYKNNIINIELEAVDMFPEGSKIFHEVISKDRKSDRSILVIAGFKLSNEVETACQSMSLAKRHLEGVYPVESIIFSIVFGFTGLGGLKSSRRKNVKWICGIFQFDTLGVCGAIVRDGMPFAARQFLPRNVNVENDSRALNSIIDGFLEILASVDEFEWGR